MKTRRILLATLGLNLALATTLVALRWRTPVATAPATAGKIVTRVVTNKVVSAPATDTLAASAAAFQWRTIESDDIRLYVANLRRVGCPEKILRDLVLAEVDRQFKSKPKFEEVSYQPWQGRDRREADHRAWSERVTAVAQEKRALIQELLGYDWDRVLSEVWDNEPSLIVALGFLSDTKALQIVALVRSQMENAEHALQHTGGIFLDEDYEKLREVRAALGADLARLLSPSEFEELESRAQLGLVFSDQLHLDGMDINGLEFREIMRVSRSYKDFMSEEVMMREKRSSADEASKLAEFEKAIAAKLGPARLAEFERAQDKDFRSALAFAKQQKLAKEAAVKVYDARRGAEQQATEIRADNSLSAEEKTAALQLLQETTAASVTGALGRAATNYFSGPGKWVDAITATSAKISKQSKGGRR